jgi:hypothetical protein
MRPLFGTPGPSETRTGRCSASSVRTRFRTLSPMLTASSSATAAETGISPLIQVMAEEGRQDEYPTPLSRVSRGAESLP